MHPRPREECRPGQKTESSSTVLVVGGGSTTLHSVSKCSGLYLFVNIYGTDKQKETKELKATLVLGKV